MDFGYTPHIIGMGISEYSGHKKLYSLSLILTCMAANVSRYHSIMRGHPVKSAGGLAGFPCLNQPVHVGLARLH